MGTYGYISIIAMVCYAFMLLMFLAAKRNKIVNSFLVVLAGLLLWTGGSAFMRAQLWPHYAFWYRVSLFGILLLPFWLIVGLGIGAVALLVGGLAAVVAGAGLLTVMIGTGILAIGIGCL